jgi:hypothetical protein
MNRKGEGSGGLRPDDLGTSDSACAPSGHVVRCLRLCLLLIWSSGFKPAGSTNWKSTFRFLVADAML